MRFISSACLNEFVYLQSRLKGIYCSLQFDNRLTARMVDLALLPHGPLGPHGPLFQALPLRNWGGSDEHWR
jgi:hypothetical protein